MFTIVLPIKLYKGKDLGQTVNYTLFKNIGLPSYEAFLDFSKLKEFILVCPADEKNDLSKLVSNSKIPFKILEDESIIHADCLNSKGWYKQQLIKLFISQVIQTENYIVLDSDLYLNQTFGFEDIFHDGKIKYSSEPWQTENSKYYSTNSKWWLNSQRILNAENIALENETRLMSVTPQVLIVKEVNLLLEKIKYNQRFLLENNFTEFTLYWIHILQENKSSLYTTIGFPLWNHDLTTNILVYQDDDENVKAVKNSFDCNSSYFSVIQGYLLDSTNETIPKLITEANKYLVNVKFKTHKKALFFVASMLVPKRTQAFTLEERLIQILNTASNIKKYIPNSICVLIEGSEINDFVRTMYNGSYDYTIECSDEKEIQQFVSHPSNIGFGELKLLERGVKFAIDELLPKFIFDFAFKLTSRYLLTNEFDIDLFDHTKYGFHQVYDSYLRQNVYTTGLYCIPISRLEEYYRMLTYGCEKLDEFVMVEKFFHTMIPERHRLLLEPIGVEGFLSYNKTYFKK